MVAYILVMADAAWTPLDEAGPHGTATAYRHSSGAELRRVRDGRRLVWVLQLGRASATLPRKATFDHAERAVVDLLRAAELDALRDALREARELARAQGVTAHVTRDDEGFFVSAFVPPRSQQKPGEWLRVAPDGRVDDGFRLRKIGTVDEVLSEVGHVPSELA